MKRIVLLLTAGALLLALTASVAMAHDGFRDFTCKKISPNACEGTSGKDHIRGTDQPNTINARGANDIVAGGGGADDLFGNNDADELRGGLGGTEEDPEQLRGGNGNDTVKDQAGGEGDKADFDELFGGDNADTLRSDDGDANDKVDGGAGTDKCVIDVGDEVVDDAEGNPTCETVEEKTDATPVAASTEA